MDEIIEKYEARLDFTTRSIELTKHLLDEDTLEMLLSFKTILIEIVADLRAIRTLTNNSNK